MALVASFAPSLSLGANDATRATNKQYALQKSSYCPSQRPRSESNNPNLYFLMPCLGGFNADFGGWDQTLQELKVRHL